MIHPKSSVIGDVELEDNTSVWPGASIRGDDGKIKIGKNCSVQDNVTIHSEGGKTVEAELSTGVSPVVA